MRIAVLSDTHGNRALAVSSLDIHGDFDFIIHLGDTTDDAEIIGLALECDIITIAGNCDAGEKYPRSAAMEIAGKRFFFCHGDRFHVKSGLDGLYQKALAAGADVVLYGHTHIPSIEEINGIMFVNPGTMKAGTRNPTMGILEIEDGTVRAEISAASPLRDPATS